ncbi:sulfite exporter TauE/SafE family protein [Clostridium estertheticum]|uniref:sulfite exporter TauE/SafE family protein n=1 Tax=Clostridium estertheticum TaxID=238834 RepID=UPI0013E93CED|nr:sulfite exporter TauE/SafE family protein [Clostridium estertheticum]MBZ9688778.1 sulfite exporter TauE/SafE family protein [Clostridium estertheticum]
MSIYLYLLAIITGIGTGVITSLIGASGVMIIVPILTMLFSVSAHTAIGTSLFVDVIASLTVSYSYYKSGNIELKSGIWIAITSIFGAQLGAMFASNMGDSNLSSSFGIVLLLAGFGMLRKGLKNKKAESNEPKKFINFKHEWQKIAVALIIGLGIGILSGIFGAGGGVMILLALIMILSFPLHKAIGTSTLIMAITALSSTIGYGARGNIDFTLGCIISVGAVIGGVVGSRYANKFNENTLQKVVGICFMAMGIIMTVIARLS